MASPSSLITLYATPFDPTNAHIAWTTSKGQSAGIVGSFPSRPTANCTWQRDNSFFRAPANINELSDFNYCVYNNNGSQNFAFITRKEYVNDNLTDVYIKSDWWHDNAGKYEFLPSPMALSHPEQDDPFSITYDREPVNVTKWFRVDQYSNIDTTPASGWFCAVSPYDLENPVPAHEFGNVFPPVPQTKEMTFAGSIYQPSTFVLTNVSIFTSWAEAYANAGMSNPIVCIYKLPYAFFTNTGWGNGYVPFMQPSTIPVTLTRNNRGIWSKTQRSTQFNKIVATVDGNSKEFDVSGWGNSNACTFSILADPSMNGSVSVMPTVYNGVTNNYAESINGYGWDTVTFSTNNFKEAERASKYAVLDQTLGSVIGGAASGAAAGGTGMAIGAVSGAVGGAVHLVSSFLGLKSYDYSGYQASIIGGGVSGTSGLASIGQSRGVTITAYAPDAPDMDAIDSHFAAVGYSQYGKILNIQTIIDSMPLWAYIQTASANIRTNGVSADAAAECVNRFNSGVTIWKDIGNYKDYSGWRGNHN